MPPLAHHEHWDGRRHGHPSGDAPEQQALDRRMPDGPQYHQRDVVRPGARHQRILRDARVEVAVSRNPRGPDARDLGGEALGTRDGERPRPLRRVRERGGV